MLSSAWTQLTNWEVSLLIIIQFSRLQCAAALQTQVSGLRRLKVQDFCAEFGENQQLDEQTGHPY